MRIKLWPVVLVEVDSKVRSDKSKGKVLDAVRAHHKETSTPATVAEIVKRTSLSKRTVDTYLPEMVASGLLQEVNLQSNAKGYQPAL